jgi:hypothetical protein
MHNLTHLADAATMQSDPRRAAIIYGAVDSLTEQTGASIFPAWQDLSDRYQATAIADAGLETFQENRFEGRHLSLDEVIQTATGDALA